MINYCACMYTSRAISSTSAAQNDLLVKKKKELNNWCGSTKRQLRYVSLSLKIALSMLRNNNTVTKRKLCERVFVYNTRAKPKHTSVSFTMQSCQLFRLLCLFAITFTCLGNNGENNWCDCERLNDMLNAHTKHLSKLVGYGRKTDKLLEWKKKFSPSNNDVRNAGNNLNLFRHF
jgi:hypothetical protein